MKEKRILLKLSGEALAGDKHTGFDEATVLEIARQVKAVHDDGAEIGVVIGGGNFWRGRTSENMDRTKADQIGMLATIMNCIYVSEMFRSTGLETEILTPFECGSVTKLFSKDRANKYFGQGKIVFFAGGTGHPYFSTDTGIVLRKQMPYILPKQLTVYMTVTRRLTRRLLNMTAYPLTMLSPISLPLSI